MTELSASHAHELNQPLTAIVSNINACLRLIAAGTSTGEVREALEDVLQDSRRASEIIERTHAVFANRPTESAPMELNDVVRDIVEIAQPRLRELQIALELRLDERLPCVVADAVQMRQVLLNLIVNATEAMREPPERRRMLGIRTCHCRNVAIVSVRDTGGGFLAVRPAAAVRAVLHDESRTYRNGARHLSLDHAEPWWIPARAHECRGRRDIPNQDAGCGATRRPCFPPFRPRPGRRIVELIGRLRDRRRCPFLATVGLVRRSYP